MPNEQPRGLNKVQESLPDGKTLLGQPVNPSKTVKINTMNTKILFQLYDVKNYFYHALEVVARPRKHLNACRRSFLQKGPPRMNSGFASASNHSLAQGRFTQESEWLRLASVPACFSRQNKGCHKGRESGNLTSFNSSPRRITSKIDECKPAGFAGGFSFFEGAGLMECPGKFSSRMAARALFKKRIGITAGAAEA
jgi:hypothetical protein